MEISMKMLKRIGLPFPEWHAVREIGAGTFGSVFRIENRQGEVCALKVIPVPYSEADIYDMMQSCGNDVEAARNGFDEQVNAILKREIATAKQCAGCRNIFRIFEEAVVDDLENRAQRYIMVRMELLTELKPYLTSPGMRQRDVLHMMENIASALAYLEGKHIIHRDIKPANIMVDGQGVYKLTDFGEARVTQREGSHTIARGTPYYMAPEVRSSSRYDHRADIYSLGMVAYYFLNGMNYPFGQFGIRPRDGYERRMNGEPCPPIAGVDPRVNKIILRCIAYRPDVRYENANELLRQLRELLKDHSVGAAEIGASGARRGGRQVASGNRANSGKQVASANSGNRANSGKQVASANSGNRANSANSGKQVASANSGNRANSANGVKQVASANGAGNPAGSGSGSGGVASGGSSGGGLSTTAIVMIVVGAALLLMIIIIIFAASSRPSASLLEAYSQQLSGGLSPSPSVSPFNTIGPIGG